MRVFVLCVGRSGSCSFYQACRFLEGYSAGHESLAGHVADRVYPDHHVEVDPQNVYWIPTLRRRYPDAKWVHLVRDRGANVESLCRQCWEAMEAFAFQWFQARHPYDVVLAAGRFYDLTNDLIAALCPDALRIETERLAEGWEELRRSIGAQVIEDGESLEQVFRRRYNPGQDRGRDHYVEAPNA